MKVRLVRHRARALGRQGRHRERRTDRAQARAVSAACARGHARPCSEALRGHDHTAASIASSCPNLGALNFLLHGALGGGGTLSLKTDAQGKVYSTALLRMEIDVPDDRSALTSES